MKLWRLHFSFQDLGADIIAIHPSLEPIVTIHESRHSDVKDSNSKLNEECEHQIQCPFSKTQIAIKVQEGVCEQQIPRDITLKSPSMSVETLPLRVVAIDEMVVDAFPIEGQTRPIAHKNKDTINDTRFVIQEDNYMVEEALTKGEQHASIEVENKNMVTEAYVGQHALATSNLEILSLENKGVETINNVSKNVVLDKGEYKLVRKQKFGLRSSQRLIPDDTTIVTKSLKKSCAKESNKSCKVAKVLRQSRLSPTKLKRKHIEMESTNESHANEGNESNSVLHVNHITLRSS